MAAIKRKHKQASDNQREENPSKCQLKGVKQDIGDFSENLQINIQTARTKIERKSEKAGEADEQTEFE